jgi:SAM-dependent methyltransferase
MTQNIYDDPLFFATYSRLGRSVDGLAGAPEWPSMRSLLPDMHGSRSLDLGCGFGWFCRWAREHGAAQVLGLDVSERMLARARADEYCARLPRARLLRPGRRHKSSRFMPRFVCRTGRPTGPCFVSGSGKSRQVIA